MQHKFDRFVDALLYQTLQFLIISQRRLHDYSLVDGVLQPVAARPLPPV